MDFLVRRPIAVIMAFLAFAIIGIATYTSLPVSLLPDIAIPQITVQMSDANMSARELETSVVSRVRQQLLQVGGLDEIHSEVRDGIGIINMRFVFGTNTDYAYIEVNEKIDAAMNYIPSGVKRPKAIKASATDIPVFYLNISLKDDTNDKGRFLQMCEAVENVIRRRVEQLPEVAMADITGVPSQGLALTPDFDKMRIYGVELSDIEAVLRNNNIDAGSMRVKDGVYEYSIKVSTLLTDQSDVENIYLQCGSRLIQLKDICRIEPSVQKEQGLSMAGDKRVVTLAVIKQSEEGMDAMRKRIGELVEQFSAQFPNLNFEISRNQTELLDYTISNLKQNLIIGFVLIIIVTILFMGGMRISIVIGISMLTAVIITILPFYISGKSLNIVSLSGLILVVGMMIDNALIVSENISQWQQRGSTLRVACVGATREMISPLLSSSLTTVAVFIPLVFIDGMAGAIFSDQAFAITAGLAVSYVVGIVLLPVIYRQMMAPRVAKKGTAAKSDKIRHFIKVYDVVIDWIMRHKAITITFVMLSLPLCWYMFSIIGKSRMPEIDYNELTARIEWNDEINVDENQRRVAQLQRFVGGTADEYSAYIGVQDFIVDMSNELSQTEAELYWKANSPDSVEVIMNKALTWIAENYPSASVKFAPPMTIFEKIFDTAEADVVAQLTANGKEATTEDIKAIEQKVKQATPAYQSSTLAFQPVKTLIINREALELYNVDLSTLRNKLSNMIAGSQITELHSYSSYMPVFINGNLMSVDEFVATGTITVYNNRTRQQTYVPVRQLVKEVDAEELKTITAGKSGDFIPIYFYNVEKADELIQTVKSAVKGEPQWTVDFGGAYYSNQKMINQLIIILLISIMLMYFIMCAQFESFKQPLIVMLEIPIDTALALVVMWLCGISLNLMSGIGIVVSCGIVINDSILKIDTINELRKGGMPLHEAIHTASHRRLRAIIMTSLTTIGAMLPILFTSDMGSELQRPLAVAMISTMTIGTLVSLFVIPFIYSLLEKEKKQI
ncbi:MAG: efflux RND transporter permease subunit [Bacteroidales bacterium]|nr:efflux RND transporter permease subunit [Bacteroidales bacterium]